MGSRGKCRCPTGHHETPQRQKPSQTTGYARHLQVETPPMLTHQNTLNPRVQTDRSGTSIQFVQERLEGHPAMFATIEPVDVHVEQRTTGRWPRRCKKHHNIMRAAQGLLNSQSRKIAAAGVEAPSCTTK
ncbi:uncharacterized protein [Dermacentor albipictus]|uniref:uncharacterized protein isoform X2 n=1 Tax=Dermacentor albipictus TaxID=60249 RepID=UPI0038FC8F04